MYKAKDRMNGADWINEIAGRVAESVRALVKVEPQLSAEDALEVVLSSSCAGPKSIARARELLGIEATK